MNKGYLLIDALISIVLVSMITLLVYAIHNIKLNYHFAYHSYNDMQGSVIEDYEGIDRCLIEDLS